MSECSQTIHFLSRLKKYDDGVLIGIYSLRENGHTVAGVKMGLNRTNFNALNLSIRENT